MGARVFVVGLSATGIVILTALMQASQKTDGSFTMPSPSEPSTSIQTVIINLPTIGGSATQTTTPTQTQRANIGLPTTTATKGRPATSIPSINGGGAATTVAPVTPATSPATVPQTTIASAPTTTLAPAPCVTRVSTGKCV